MLVPIVIILYIIMVIIGIAANYNISITNEKYDKNRQKSIKINKKVD